MIKYLIFFIIFILLVLLAVNIIDLNRFTVSNYTCQSPKIRENCKVVVLADLHDKSYGKYNYKLIKAIRDINPDFIIVAGDIINASPRSKNNNATALIVRLAAEFPVYYGFGNHEYRARIYPKTYGKMYDDFMEDFTAAGVCVLSNEDAFLEKYNIRTVGLEIDRQYYKRFKKHVMDEKYIEECVGMHNKDAFEILIAHNPDYFNEYMGYGSDLVLSGHVHGGLIRLPLIGGVAHPGIRFFPKYSKGEYRSGEGKMIVSAGLGTHTLPLRLFNPGDLVVIDLERTSQT